MASSTPRNPLIAFFRGTGADSRGRTLDEILKFSDSKLERSHDYIQTVFPLPEESGVNWDAPLVDRSIYDAFRLHQDLQDSMRTALERMALFYGFKLIIGEDGTVDCPRLAIFAKQSQNWVQPFDHNHLRITRIIRSLRVLGLDAEAEAFHRAVTEVQAESDISRTSLKYWNRAMHRPINIAPDVEEDLEHAALGPRWLRSILEGEQ